MCVHKTRHQRRFAKLHSFADWCVVCWPYVDETAVLDGDGTVLERGAGDG
jgi:hypothetical protein